MKLTNFIQIWKALGWGGIKAYLHMKFEPGSVRWGSLKQPIFLRWGTTDIPTFKAIFFRREYEVPFEGTPKVILDLGANVGYASVYFANRFPEAKIIALEPASENFEQLKKNTRSYSGVQVLQSAVWSSGKSLKVVDLGQSWAYQVMEVPEGTPNSFTAKSIPDLMTDFQLDYLDIVKIDIEGAECELFARNFESWVARTKMIIVEFHEQIFPGSTQPIIALLTGMGFSVSVSGEYHVFVRK